MNGASVGGIRYCILSFGHTSHLSEGNYGGIYFLNILIVSSIRSINLHIFIYIAISFAE
jgi:hypothetical protein